MTPRPIRCLTSVVDAIGNTPLLRLRRVTQTTPGVEVFVKLEFANPGGSVKDRPARQMVLHGLEIGQLGRGQTLIDATSGNTGVAYALLGAAMGFPVVLVMPRNVTEARKNVARAFGAEFIYSDPMEGTDGAIRKVREIVAAAPERYFYPDQYGNPHNPLAHYLGTGQEIVDAVGDRITHFVTGVGTSGTMMGTTRRLREHVRPTMPPIHCVCMQPAEQLHGLEGLKHMPTSLVPSIYDPSLPQEHISMTTEEGWDMADRVCAEEGLHVGHSSGANIASALRLAAQLHARGTPGCIVTIACDRGDRYFAPMKWEKKLQW